MVTLLTTRISYNSSRPCSESLVGDICSSGSAACAPSFVSTTGAVPTLARMFTSTAAILERMRPSSASLRANREISESYSSHSGIARARASFGSFCRNVQKLRFVHCKRNVQSKDFDRDQWSSRGEADLWNLKKSCQCIP
jgi:hypothetical protein